MNETIAIIRWPPESRGGRLRPPDDATGYSTVARFESDPESKLGTWSVRLSNVSELGSKQCVRAAIQFLFPEGPAKLLSCGERFELMEGHRVVAKGVVVPSQTSIPETINDFDLALLG